MKLSPTQIKMLQNVRDGLSYDDSCNGASEHGGASGTLRSLITHGLLIRTTVGPVITAFGRITLDEIGETR